MREYIEKRKEYWVVEAIKNGKVIYYGEYDNFDVAWEKYYSYKGKASVMLQRRYREYKVSA